eukprot:TRINITY_DN20956_c0_g1_i2.p1 TRINITY_DN20956_c0_g1~~TRINITY_DN20956_c0_g1_i2.p1  ORF type:complete len:1025 (+),score=303.12 TRINITY_DN20956_c0_g1_i2:49-3123(+)
MGGVDFSDLISVSGFIAALYSGGWISEALRIPSFVGEILVGVLLGPELASLLPDKYAEFMELIGNLGITLMIFESGMHIHYDKLKVIALRTTIVAVLGTALPILSGVLFVYLVYGDNSNNSPALPPGVTATPTAHLVPCDSEFGCVEDTTQSSYPDGFSLGCTLAPTSVTIALKLLTESKQLDSLFGQTIITGAFLDDIFSIIALLVLLNLAEGGINAAGFALPLVFSVVFLVVGGAIAFKVFPLFVRKVVELTPLQMGGSSFHPAHHIQLLLMFSVLSLYGFLSNLLGSHLLGAFVAGMSFSHVPRSQQVWARQMKRITKWLTRAFFGATVAFSIPIKEMMTLRVFYLGVICAIGPCVLSKIISGLVAESPYKLVVGTAMVARGEFAYLVARSAKNKDHKVGSRPYGKMMSTEVYSIAMWALLIGTALAPYGFHFFQRSIATQKALERAHSGKTNIFSFRLKVKGQYVPFIVHDVLSALKDLDLIADNSNVETDGAVFMMTTTVTTKTETVQDALDDEAFETIKHHIFEVLNDEDGQVMMVPILMKKAVQIGEIKFLNDQGEINLRNAVATNIGGDNPSAMQGPEGAIKKSVKARWTDRNQQPLTIKFAEPEVLTRYTFVTAKDFSDNATEPISWRLEGVTEGSDNWKILHEVENYPTPADRNMELPLFNLDGPRAMAMVRFVPVRLPATDGQPYDTAHVTGHRYRPGVHFTKDFEDEAHFIVIKVMGEPEIGFIVRMFHILQELNLDIHKAKMYQTVSAGSTEVVSIKVLYCKDVKSSGRPTKARLAAIQTKLHEEFDEHGIKARAIVMIIRCENAPSIYGFTPTVAEGEHVGEFVFVYKHPRLNKQASGVWCPLTAVLEWMHSEAHFDIVNLAMDIDLESSRDHITIFAKDPEFNQHSTQDTIVSDLIEIFKEKSIPAHVSVHLHQWQEDQDKVVTVIGEEGVEDAFKRITEGGKGASVLSFQGESIGLLRSNDWGSQLLEDKRANLISETLEVLRRQINTDIDEAVGNLVRAPTICTEPY